MNLSRGLAAAIAVSLVTVWAPAAMGDGKVFRHSEAVVPMVDQEAVIAFKDGVEVLAIRTRADGRATGAEPLAWVVPVPGPDAPELLTTTDGTFATARAITQPRLRDHREGGIGAYFLLMATLLFVAAALVRANPGVPRWQRVLMGVTVGVLTPILSLACLLPALGQSRSSAGPSEPSAGVETLKHERVGTLDVSVVRAKGDARGDGAAALAEWLARAGCAVPANAAPVLQRYAAEGWVFVAARLAAGGGGERLEPTPLVMKFKADRPVYPLRLTGVDNGSLGLELCVLADGTAYAGGLAVARSSPLAADAEGGADPDAIQLRHEGLARLSMLAGGPAWITRLSGTLPPAGQQTDMVIDVKPGIRVNESFYTREAVSLIGFDIGAALAGLAMIGLAAALFLRRWSQGQIAAAFGACLLFGTLAGFTTAAALPRYSGEVRQTRSPAYILRHAVRRMVIHSCADLEGLRSEIARRRAGGDFPFADLPEEGDRPWGFTLYSDAKGDVWVQTYDRFGGRAEVEGLYGVGLEPASKR